jgi:hypothetical protein
MQMALYARAMLNTERHGSNQACRIRVSRAEFLPLAKTI